jgi:hypothetical protein
MAMSDDQGVFKFDKSFLTGDVIAHQVAQIQLGRDGIRATVRLVLFPDGVHLFVSDGAKRFIHPTNDGMIVPVGVPDAAK